MTSTTWVQNAGMDSGTDSDTVLTYAETAQAAAEAAAAQAGIATTQAETATTQAGIATSAASDALASATVAAERADDVAAALGYRDVASATALIADAVLTYSAGVNQVLAGEVVRTRNEGFSFQVAPSSATNNDVITAGGVKLYKLPSQTRIARVGRATTPTVASAGAGVLTGQHYWTVSHVTADGETDVSNSTGLVTAGNSVTVTIPVSNDWRVIARRIYRTVSGGIEPQAGYLVAEVSDNTTTTYVDNVADVSLGAMAPQIDTTGWNIVDGVNIEGNISSLSTTFGFATMPNAAGYACTALGAYALTDNTNGYRNTAVGTDALYHNTTGANNTGVGVHALDRNTTGTDHTAVGLNSLFVLDGSLSCTAIGSNAGAQLTTGNFNTFVGAGAGQLKTSGAGNTYVGYQAGYAAGAGSQNAALGQNALGDITNGNFNLGIGYAAGGDITTGNQNVAIGWSALSSMTTGSGNIAIGPRAGQYQTGSNTLIIDTQNRTDAADELANALVVGTMGLTRSNQRISFNGQVNPLAGIGVPGRTITADGAVIVDDTSITCSKVGATLTLTLPTGSADKIIILRNTKAFTVVSATANVEQIDGASITSAILPATAGSWAALRCKSSGISWEIVMRG